MVERNGWMCAGLALALACVDPSTDTGPNPDAAEPAGVIETDHSCTSSTDEIDIGQDRASGLYQIEKCTRTCADLFVGGVCCVSAGHYNVAPDGRVDLSEGCADDEWIRVRTMGGG